MWNKSIPGAHSRRSQGVETDKQNCAMSPPRLQSLPKKQRNALNFHYTPPETQQINLSPPPKRYRQLKYQIDGRTYLQVLLETNRQHLRCHGWLLVALTRPILITRDPSKSQSEMITQKKSFHCCLIGKHFWQSTWRCSKTNMTTAGQLFYNLWIFNDLVISSLTQSVEFYIKKNMNW